MLKIENRQRCIEEKAIKRSGKGYVCNLAKEKASKIEVKWKKY